MEAEDELNRLALILQQSQEKFLEWTGEGFRNQIIEQSYQHEREIKTGKEKIAELEEKIKQYNEETDRKLQAIQQQQSEVEDLEKQLQDLQLSAQVLAEQRDNDKDHLQMLEQQISRENKDIMDKEEAAKAKLEHFQKGSELFRKSLGLEFKKIDDDHLQFVFKYIDPNDWERPFTFTVRIDSNDRSYKVKDCMPEIQDLDKMVEELNSSGHFSKFVYKVRNKFKELAKKSVIVQD
ncbi:kinetochore protein Spc25 [Nematostella vectensis]|uniref:kinetochore protein Spc25 n=1 Tax=Nematostella vectensis TaxID=45351 RepID=UPI002077946E|nr:kinetochore protein Spc25 [Nematostella vectensis]